MNSQLLHWFEKEKRTFPWREEITPYRVWISEIMLQQTLASVVVDYFERWMARFPTISDLARASEEEVIKAWEGLGYYSRARNIHKTAKRLVNEHGGKLPSDRAALETLPGLGPYTVGAILSFAFKKRAVAIDGNVIRVLSRYYGIEDIVDRTPVKRMMTERLLGDLPASDPHVAMEALIELGALVCKKNPQCHRCPLQEGCVAHKKGNAATLPRKKPRVKGTHLHRLVFLLHFEGKYHLRQGAKGAVMEGLYEFPYHEGGHPFIDVETVGKKILQTWGIEATFDRSLEMIAHTFTRFKAHLYPAIWHVTTPPTQGLWVTRDEIATLPFSSGHRKLLPHLR